MKRILAAGMAAGLIAAGCNAEDSPNHESFKGQKSFSDAVQKAAFEGGEVDLPSGVECDFDQLIGGLAVQRRLGENVVVVESPKHGVPEFGLIDCLEGDPNTLRGNDGY